MNKYTQQQIEEKLKILASIEPSAESAHQMNQSVRRIISGAGRKPTTRSFFYYAAASAAMLLIGMSFLYDFNPAATPPTTSLYSQSGPRLTLAKLNAVFQSGGDKALDDYFEMVESNRQPRTETITLQEIMKEL
ncbi:MAG: hypothetical protein ACYSU8_05900 [Planctomycetota bacterium]|jgi:hypothetical protein